MHPASLLACALLFAAQAASAQETAAGGSRGEFAFSNDTLQLRYVGGADAVGAGGGSAIDAAFFLSEERDIVLSGGLMFPAGPITIAGERLALSVGPKAYAALLEDENQDVFAISAGAEVRLLLEQRTGLAIVGHAFYAPDILTFGVGDRLTDLSARAEMRLAPRVTAFAGMRWFEFDLTEGQGERTLQEEVFVGFGYRL